MGILETIEMAAYKAGDGSFGRRTFVKGAAVMVFATVLGQDCIGNDDGGNKTDKLAEPGRYIIRKANEIYPVSDIPDAEAEIKKFEKWADDQSAGEPLNAISAMPYSVKHNIYNGTITPKAVAGVSTDDGEYPFDTNAITMDMITQYLDGKIDESKFKGLFDDDSFDELVLMKKKGLTVDKYAVTEGRDDGDTGSVKYLINTYKTKADASGQVLTGYLHIKLEKSGTRWVPKAIIESEVYTPTGELGFYYAGNDKHRGGNASHVWIEKKGVPLISEAIPYIGKGMTVDKLAREVMGYNNGLDERIVNEQKEGGGKVIVLTRGKVDDYKFPVVNYAHTRLGGRIAPDKFDDLRAIYEYPDENMDTVIISDAIENGISNGFAYLLEVRGGIIQVQDGFGWPDDRIRTPADGKLELVVP